MFMCNSISRLLNSASSCVSDAIRCCNRFPCERVLSRLFDGDISASLWIAMGESSETVARRFGEGVWFLWTMSWFWLGVALVGGDNILELEAPDGVGGAPWFEEDSELPTTDVSAECEVSALRLLLYSAKISAAATILRGGRRERVLWLCELFLGAAGRDGRGASTLADAAKFWQASSTTSTK